MSVQVSTQQKTIREQIVCHPILSFLTLAYTISWTAWFFMNQSGVGWFNGFAMIGGMGPALAAMIVSAIQRPQASTFPARKYWRLVGMFSIGFLVVLIARRFWLTTELTTVVGRVVTDQIYSSLMVFLLDVLAATLAAFVFSGFLSPRQGVCDLLRSFDLRQNRPRWCWFMIAIGLYPSVVLFGNAISQMVGLPEVEPRATGSWYYLALDMLLVYLVTLFGGGGLEEPGWRGFVLPWLQKRYNPLRSSLILAVFWAFWHWPMFWLGVYEGGPLGVFPFIIGCIPPAILFTALYSLSKSSLPVVILFHTTNNITPTFLSITTMASGLWWLLIFGVAIWMWKSPQIFAPKSGDWMIRT